MLKTQRISKELLVSSLSWKAKEVGSKLVKECYSNKTDGLASKNQEKQGKAMFSFSMSFTG